MAGGFAIASAAIDLFTGIVDWAFGLANAKNERQRQFDTAYLNAISQYNQLENQVTQTGLAIKQTEANISAFDQALTRWQSEFDLSLEAFQQEGEAAYNELYQNWQGTELAMAATGRVGGSAALVAAQRKAQLEAFAGSDLKLNADGGMYGASLSSFYLDSFAGLTELQGNRDIAAESLGIYEDSLAAYEAQLQAQGTVVLDYMADDYNKINGFWWSTKAEQIRSGDEAAVQSYMYQKENGGTSLDSSRLMQEVMMMKTGPNTLLGMQMRKQYLEGINA